MGEHKQDQQRRLVQYGHKQAAQLTRQHYSVDNIPRLNELNVPSSSSSTLARRTLVGAGKQHRLSTLFSTGSQYHLASDNATMLAADEQKSSAITTATTTATKMNRFGWKSWSSHKLADLAVTRRRMFGRCSSKDSCFGKDGSRITTVMATAGQGSDKPQEVSYADAKVIGNGSFGVVYQAKLCATGEMVAIKKVLQDKRFKNRELQIMRKLNHCNIVLLKYFFYSSGDQKDEVYLNLVLEYVPETVYKVSRHYNRSKQTIPISFIKLYMYQLFRALAYIHSLGIGHRDIKPQNLLLDPESGVLKLCDFGSAKNLVPGEPNVSYICSRYYRAPELIFGAINYTTNIDVWSAGCVLAELLLGQPIFPGDSGVDQLVEIIKVLGTPTREQLSEMNPNYTEFKFPQIRAHPWKKLLLERTMPVKGHDTIRVFRSRTPAEAIDLVSRLLKYTPTVRVSPLQACAHAFFNELREPNARLPSGRHLPPLFNFSSSELKCDPSLRAQLVPSHITNTSSSTSSVTAGAELLSATAAAGIDEAALASTSSGTAGTGVMVESATGTGTGTGTAAVEMGATAASSSS